MMGERAIAVTINGTRWEGRADEQLPLLWFLRDVVGLTGTKYGCGVNQCRACTVTVNGELKRSCTTKCSDVSGKQVRTIEGLSADVSHPLQQAWIIEQVPQCGYCQSGVLMAAAALLERTPRPTDAQIDDAIANLCACGTYDRIRQGIKRAAGML